MRSNYKKLGYYIFTFGFLLCFCTSANLFATSINFYFSNLTDAELRFYPNSRTFEFTSLDGNGNYVDQSDSYEWKITSPSNSPLHNLVGYFDGTFTIRTILNLGYMQIAPVTGIGILGINDGLGNELTGNIVWNSIFTVASTGAMNHSLNLNVTNISYNPPSGSSNTGLESLRDASENGVINLTFQFTTTHTLMELTGEGSNSDEYYGASYSGSYSSVAEPGLLLLTGLGLFGIAAGCRTFRK